MRRVCGKISDWFGEGKRILPPPPARTRHRELLGSWPKLPVLVLGAHEYPRAHTDLGVPKGRLTKNNETT